MQGKNRVMTWKWFMPLIIAAPILAAAALTISHWGPTLKDLLNILVKVAVVS